MIFFIRLNFQFYFVSFFSVVLIANWILSLGFSELICDKYDSFSYVGTIAINFPCNKTLNFANNNNKMNELFLFFVVRISIDIFYVLLHFMFFYFNFIMLLHNNTNFCCGFFSLLLIQFKTECIFYNFFYYFYLTRLYSFTNWKYKTTKIILSQFSQSWFWCEKNFSLLLI